MATKKIGFTLSGGATRGYAHLGMLDVLYKHDIKPEIISGTSIGALTGALLADGHEPEAIYAAFKKKSFYNFVRPAFKFGGILNLDGMANFLGELLSAKTFEDLKIPLRVVATDYMKGTAEIFDSGPLLQALMASSAVPMVFQPIKIEERYFIDGGLYHNLPTKIIRDQCDFLIACNLVSVPPLNEKPSQLGFADRVISMAVASNVNFEKTLADFLLEPTSIHEFGFFDNSASQKLFEAGRLEALEKMQNLKSALNSAAD
jgi:NTE family protein